MIKRGIITVLTWLLFQQLSAQEMNYNKPFFTGSFNTTFAINEDYTFEEGDGEPFLIPASMLIRIGVGYQFNRRFSLSGNIGYDYHFNYFINAIPTYVTAQYNIAEDFGDTFYIAYSHGKMFRPSAKFEDGNYYGFGVGWQFKNEKNDNRASLEITYHRKLIADFENGRLDSISIGVGITIF